MLFWKFIEIIKSAAAMAAATAAAVAAATPPSGRASKGVILV